MINQMNVEALKSMLDNNENIILVDCRENDEYEQGHIKGSKLLPLSNFEEEITVLDNKDAKIILQCRSGKRSMNAAMFLKEQGYTDLTNLEGGILAWAESGFNIEK